MGEFGGGDQADSLRFCLRQNVPQSLECCPVRVADRHGLALLARTAQSYFELFADRGHLGDVVEKWDVSEGRANSKVPRRFVSHGSGGCPAVHVEKAPVAQHRHQLIHQRGVSSSL